MIAIDEMIHSKEYELYNDSGKVIDSFFSCYLYSFKDVPRHFKHIFEFKSKKIDYWEKFAQDNEGGIYFEQDKIISVFNPNSDFPFFRFYFFETKEQDIVVQLIQKYHAIPLITSELLKGIQSDTDLADEAQKWFEKMKRDLKPSTIISEGRNSNTTIEQAIILHRQPNGCVVCGENATGYVSSILSGAKTKYFIANVCDKHKEEAQLYPNFLNYILSLFNASEYLPPMNMDGKVSEKMLNMLYQEIENELESKEIKEKRNHKIVKEVDQYTTTFERESGFKVIIRLRTLMDYGYVINYPNETQFKRIDAEDHHNEILDFSPDHIHNKPEDKTKVQQRDKTIQSSYTTGFPLFDIPAIKNMLEEGEEKWQKK